LRAKGPKKSNQKKGPKNGALPRSPPSPFLKKVAWITKNFLESYAAADSLGLTRTLVPMEKLKRDQLIQELTLWLQVLENALASRSGMTADLPMAGKIAGMRSGKQLLSHIKTLQKCIQYAQGNVSVAAICGYLQWELR
jgi:hypothetical protein